MSVAQDGDLEGNAWHHKATAQSDGKNEPDTEQQAAEHQKHGAAGHLSKPAWQSSSLAQGRGCGRTDGLARIAVGLNDPYCWHLMH